MLVAERRPCGSLISIHERVPGRPDDTFVFGPDKIYPDHIDQILSDTNEVGSEYHLILTGIESGKDKMAVKVECVLDALAQDNRGIKKAIKHEVKKQILADCEAEAVDYAALPRSERKMKGFWATEIISDGQGTAFRESRPGAHA
jgi:phenylacetate-CoA ligase